MTDYTDFDRQWLNSIQISVTDPEREQADGYTIVVTPDAEELTIFEETRPSSDAEMIRKRWIDRELSMWGWYLIVAVCVGALLLTVLIARAK